MLRISLAATTFGLLVGHGLAATTSMLVCNEDNCLRAVQASAFPTRHGSADCSSYFLTTVTPATTTATTTKTIYTPVTAVRDVTATTVHDVTLIQTSDITATSTMDVAIVETADITATSTLDVTAVQTSDVTATSTVDVTLVETDDVTAIGTVLTTVATVTSTITTSIIFEARGGDNYGVGLAPRQATVTPSSIPTYASACSGSVGYSSACFCVGATKSTTTAATPTTTKTVTVTLPTTVSTSTTSDATVVVTTTDSTSIFITTDATTAATTTDSTSIFTTTDATVVVITTDITSTLITIDATATVVITDSTSTFTTTVATATDIVSETVTSNIPVATDYPQCSSSNLISSYNGLPITELMTGAFIYVPAASNAYECCVACLTTSGCGVAAFYPGLYNECFYIPDGGTCSASNQVGQFITGSGPGPDGVIIISNTPCGQLVYMDD